MKVSHDQDLWDYCCAGRHDIIYMRVDGDSVWTLQEGQLCAENM